MAKNYSRWWVLFSDEVRLVQGTVAIDSGPFSGG